MIIRLTVRDAELSTEHDLEITADPQARLSSLLGILPPRPCFVGTIKLDPETTFADSPLIPGTVISVGEPAPTPLARPPTAAGALRVVSGPDAGRTVWLEPGTHLAGRERDAGIRLIRDQGISRYHARLEVSKAGELTVTDLGSTNGTLIAEHPITAPTRLYPEAILQLGDDRLRWVPLPSARPRTDRGPDGLVGFDRVIAKPPAPAVPEKKPPWEQNTTQGRKHREHERTHEDDERLLRHAVREQWLRQVAAPDELDLTIAATHDGPGLWSRDAGSPDGLTLRVGVADDPAEGGPGLRGVPVTVDLREVGVLGVVGPRPPVDSLLRWLLVQLCTLRAPGDLRVVVLTANGGDHLAWTRWLPHLNGGRRVPCLVGNTEESRAERIEELRELVARRPKRPDRAWDEEVLVVLDGARTLRELPGMREVLRQGPEAGVFAICADRRGMNECRGVCELDGTDLLLTRGRADLPVPIQPEGLSEEAAERLARALAPMRYRPARAEPGVPLSVRLLDAMDLETPAVPEILARWASAPGPATIGADGTGPVGLDLTAYGPHTLVGGAGKGPLLRALVTSLMLSNRPDELNLVLVGCAGSATFLPFEGCPHVVGLLSATGATAADVFDESAAQRVLASVMAEVRRREALAGGDGLPRLVMIFDDVPRQLSGELMKATAGRALGLHLVLAPQGTLSPELRNTVIVDRRGRGMIMRSGGGQPFQTGRLDSPPPADVPFRSLPLTWAGIGLPRPAPSSSRGARTDLELAVEAVIRAAEDSGHDPLFRPLLPPLPAVLDLDQVPADESAVPYGLVDDPAGQAQPAMTFDPRGSERLLVAGGPKSGRTTFARTLIGALARHPCWIYAIENRPGGLAGYEGCCGAVASSAEPDRIRRILTWLAAEADRRRSAQAADPPIVLVIDGWEYFSGSSLLSTLQALVTEGPQLGIHTVAIGGEEMLRGGAPGLFTERLLLPFVREEIRRGHLTSGMVSPPILPGRAINAVTGLAVQIAAPPAPIAPRLEARPFPPMPETVERGLLDAAAGVAIGVGGADVSTIALDLFGSGPHVVLVSGPPGSGRSNAALLLASALLAEGIHVLALAPPRSPLASLPGARVLTGTSFTDADLREATASWDRFAVVADDYDQITFDSPLLREMAAPSSLGSRALILAGDATPILEGGPHYLAPEVTKAMRTGARVVLTPSSGAAAHVHGLLLEPDQLVAGPPGRGYLALARRVQLVQLARFAP